ncbi:UGAT, partial [Symbiodinium necroappetens]
SLLPTVWSNDHENAWAWFWTIVEKKVEENKKLPVHNHQCLRTFLARLDEEALANFKLKVFDSFFANCEESQLYLRAANKRLMYIMGRILTIMSDIYTKTHQAVIALSALGLLHAGHGVPEDLVRPFVAAFMGGIKENCPDESMHDGLWWTLDLIGRIFIRTLSEGSTPVIIAINRNTSKAMKLAVANYPRGERGHRIDVPLIWAIEKGALESAKEILNDLLTMRADRARYYYGMEMLFTRHSDIISLLCTTAPSLLPTLFDGLIWRSKNVKNGMRRANYYIASLLRGEDGQLTDSLLDLIKHGDPEIICHPTVVFQADLLWTRLCCLPWALTKLWFCVTLVVYVMAEQQAVTSSDPLSQERFTTIVCRAFLYIGSLGQLFAKHAYQTYRAVRQKQMTRRTLCCEPVLHCLAVSSELLTNCCEYGEWQCHLIRTYNRLAAFPMMLYFVLASELVHLNVSLSVFSVICSCLMWEFILYVAVLAFFTAAFASAVACLPPSLGTDSIQMRDFFSWPLAFESLLSSAFNVYGSDNYEQISVADEPMLKWIVMAFAACWHVYLMNLMVAQLCQRYNDIYHDARGNARLTRGINIYETSMPLISKKRWTAFVESLHLEEACELDEGDNGPRGAVPTTEDPYDYWQYPKVELDRVQRYGGLANPALPWPSLEEAVDDSAVGKLTRMTQAKFEEMDRLMVDMAIKLQVRPPGTSGGTKEPSAMHSEKRDESKIDGHEQDVGTAKETDISKELAELSEELPVNEATANELVQERTEEGEAMSVTPYDVNGTSVVSGSPSVAEFEKKVAQTGASIVGLDMGGADADSLEKKAREQKRIMFLLLQELMTSPLEKELLLDRPDVVMTDFATLAGCAVAQKLGIP